MEPRAIKQNFIRTSDLQYTCAYLAACVVARLSAPFVTFSVAEEDGADHLAPSVAAQRRLMLRRTPHRASACYSLACSCMQIFTCAGQRLDWGS